VQHNFKPAQFKELRINASISAMERILAGIKHVSVVRIDSIACGYILRCTHRLSCAHEIVEYNKQGHPVLLESVHAH